MYRNALEMQDLDVVAINEYVRDLLSGWLFELIIPRYSPFIDLHYMVRSIELVHVASIHFLLE